MAQAVTQIQHYSIATPFDDRGIRQKACVRV